MKIHCKYTGIKGFVTVYNRAVRYAYMNTKTALQRMKILDHWKQYGLESAIHTFEVSERTLWDWKARLDKGRGKPESLNPKSKAPKVKRKRLWDFRILDEEDCEEPTSTPISVPKSSTLCFWTSLMLTVLPNAQVHQPLRD